MVCAAKRVEGSPFDHSNLLLLSLGDRSADAARAAGDQSNLSSEGL
jgi:hypothetical protein